MNSPPTHPYHSVPSRLSPEARSCLTTGGRLLVDTVSMDGRLGKTETDGKRAKRERERGLGGVGGE